MSIIIRLQNLPWSANSLDIRRFFTGLSIPEGGVHIVGGEMGDAFIAFSTDEDARLAMEKDGGKIKDMQIKLLLSSRTEMMRVIEQARQQNMVVTQPHIVVPPPILSLQQPTRIMTPTSESERKRDHTPSPHRHSRDRSPVRDRRHSPDDRHAPKRDRSRSPSRSSRNFNRDMDRRNDRFRRDDRHYDDSRYRDDRRHERETIQESKRYPDADHVNSKSQLHATEGFRNVTPSYEHMNAGIPGLYPYGNQLTAAKGFQEPFAHAPTNLPSHFQHIDQMTPHKSKDFPTVEDQKYPLSSPYPQDSLSYRGSTFESSTKDISLSSMDQSNAKSRRRTRFEPEFAPTSISSHFPSDDPKSSLQNQQGMPYNDARNLPENFPGNYPDRNTWPHEQIDRLSNKPWNGKQENLMNPAMSKDGGFLPTVAMDIDPSPSDISVKGTHRGPQVPILNDMMIRNDDLRRDNQNRGLPLDKGHPIQDRAPISRVENRKTPVEKDREPVMHSEKGGLPLPERGLLSREDNRAQPLSYGENRVLQRQDRGPMPHDESRAHLMQDRGLMPHGENRVQDRGPIEHDENQAFLMQGREPILRGEPREHLMQDRGAMSRGDTREHLMQDRGAMSHGETREHLIMQDRGTMLRGENRGHLMQDRGTMHRGENREHLMQDRGAISRGENREHMIQGRGTISHSENREHLMQDRAVPHGENREHLMQDRGAMPHGENREHLMPGRAPISHGENREHLMPSRAPILHGENREHLMPGRAPISRGENREHLMQDKGTVLHGENREQLTQKREAITHGEPRVHPIEDRAQMSQGDGRQMSHGENKSTSVQDRGPKLQNENKGSPVKDKGVISHSDSHSQKLHNDSPGRIPPSLTVEVKGLPPDARIDDILDIFRGITLPAANIRIEANNLGLEKAFIRFVSVADYEEALRRNQKLINEGRCELIPCPAAAYDSAPNFQKPRPKLKRCDEDLIVQLRGLPFSCKEDDVVNFFDGLGILDLFIEIAPDGRAAGNGFVEFGKNEDFRAALRMNGKMIGHRYINVSIASKEMMTFFRNQANKNEPPGPHFPNSGHPSNPPVNEARHPPNHMRPPGPQINQARQNTPPVQSRPPPCISMKGLPEGVTNRDIVDFLAQVNVMPRAIHIMLRPDKTPSGEAFAEFGSPSDMDAAMQLDANIMKGSCVLLQPISFHEMSDILGRPSLMPQPSAPAPLLRTPGEGERPRRPPPVDIERPRRPIPGEGERPRRPLLPQTPNEGSFRERPRMDQPSRPFGPPRMRAPWSGRPYNAGNRPDSRFPPPERGLKDFGAPGCIVSIKNLHFRAGLEELLDFFHDYRITKDSIRRKYNENGQTTGEARIALPSPRDAQRAVRDLNQKPIMGRSLQLSVL